MVRMSTGSGLCVQFASKLGKCSPSVSSLTPGKSYSYTNLQFKFYAIGVPFANRAPRRERRRKELRGKCNLLLAFSQTH